MIFDNIIGPERPVTWVFRFWPILAGSFAGSLAATWLCKNIAIKLGIVDRPDDLVKTHKEPIAYLGGIGMLIGLTVGVLAGIGCLRNEEFFRPALKWLFGILAGGTIACFVGLTDDIYDIKPRQKIFGQVGAALILLLVGIVPSLRSIAGFFNCPMPDNLEIVLQVLIVIFFVLGATNSLNLLDGLDGLCAGVTGIITIAMLMIAIHNATWKFSVVDDPVIIIICLSLVGVAFGFLPFNRHPARIFMGDAGSLPLGFLIGITPFVFYAQDLSWTNIYNILLVVCFVVLCDVTFFFDAALTLVRRTIRRTNIFQAHREHIYQKVFDAGISARAISLYNFALTLIASSVAVYLLKTTNNLIQYYLFATFIVIVLYLLLLVAAYIVNNKQEENVDV